MEETLGKRIIANRKRLGMTQDRLAEKLGVTAQAVSKWENDQSCPDISMLPRLAELFGITTDALLGIEAQQPVHEAEVVSGTDSEPEGLHFSGPDGNWEFKWDGGRKNSIGFALWVLLTGGLLFTSNLLNWGADLWDIAWPTGLLIFGLFGLFPKFSFFRFGCTLFGGYFLAKNMLPGFLQLDKTYLLPIFLLLFGLSLLAEAFRKNKKPSFQVFRDGRRVYSKDGKQAARNYTVNGESFQSSVSFGSEHQYVQLPRLSSGSAEVSFGELEIDLSGCEEFAEGCTIDADCSFGELTVYVPRNCRVEPASETAFGSVEISGSPVPDAGTVIHMNCSANFGEIQIQYI